MSHLALRLDGIGKQYRIGSEVVRAETFSQSVVNTLKAPFQNLKFLRSLSNFEDEDDETIFWALRDVSFDVAHGDVVGLIGRNGAGKSTLLKVLSRITEPSEGRIEVYGRIASLLEVGTGFNVELTGRENTYLNGAILGMSKAEVDRKFDEIVDFSGIEKFIDTPVKRYSSGMKVRLGFAVAAHLEPDILLVDEVLAVGDISFQRKCLGKMDDVAGEGRTVIFVSHQMSMIQSLCKRGILLEEGRVVHDGDVDDAVELYVRQAEDQAEGTSLGERTDRKGGESFRFQQIRFFDGDSEVPTEILMTGRPVRIELDYEYYGDSPIGDVVASFNFKTQTGTLLCALRSDAVGRTFTVDPGRGTLQCTVPKLPLSGGRYQVACNARHRGELIDRVQEAGFVDIENGDYYGTGIIPVQSSQTVLVDFDWERMWDKEHV